MPRSTPSPAFSTARAGARYGPEYGISTVRVRSRDRVMCGGRIGLAFGPSHRSWQREEFSAETWRHRDITEGQ